MNIYVKKLPLACAYVSQRNSATDFPVLACAASLTGDDARTVIGARPGRALCIGDEKGLLKGFASLNKTEKKKAVEAFAEYAAQTVPTGSNMRGSKEYRTHLVKVLTRRAWEAVGGMSDEN